MQGAGHGPRISHLSELNIPDQGMRGYFKKDSDYILTYSLDNLQGREKEVTGGQIWAKVALGLYSHFDGLYYSL